LVAFRVILAALVRVRDVAIFAGFANLRGYEAIARGRKSHDF
jgi:hypothetical protein